MKRLLSFRASLSIIAFFPTRRCICSPSSWKALEIQWVRELARNAVPEPKLSVKYILQHVMNKFTENHRGKKWTESIGDPTSDIPLRVAQRMLKQRLARVPVQYIIGEWDFRNVTLKMRPPVLIPRPETEGLAGLVLEHCCGGVVGGEREERTLMFLDVGCGSGAISIALLQESTRQLQGFAVDVSEKAVNLTWENAELSGVSDHLSVFQCSAEACPDLLGGKQVDFIVSNPPYVTTEEMALLQPEILWYEDPQALDGGSDGLNVIADILNASKHVLRRNGQLWLETGIHQDIHRLIRTHGEWRMAYESAHMDSSGRY